MRICKRPAFFRRALNRLRYLLPLLGILEHVTQRRDFVAQAVALRPVLFRPRLRARLDQRLYLLVAVVRLTGQDAEHTSHLRQRIQHSLNCLLRAILIQRRVCRTNQLEHIAQRIGGIQVVIHRRVKAFTRRLDLLHKCLFLFTHFAILRVFQQEEIVVARGIQAPGVASPYRDRPVEESLELFNKMNTPEAVEGSMVLRAKIDMANANMHFRDPIIYRIIQIPHHRTGTKWHAYPMYDFAHGQSDFFEGVTHSICTLEFVPHRPLYDLFIDYLKEMRGETENLYDFRPRQIEFNRLNLTYTVMSKRKLHTLVDEHLVAGWDDPRMPTICGMRRRGYSPESIRNFIKSIGYTKFDALNDMALLEAAVRDDLNKKALRVSAVLNPVKLVITNYPDNQTEEMEAINNPEDETAGTHTITFSKNLWIERDDFMEDAPKKFFRMTPGKEVRLKNAYIVMCTGCTKDENGNIIEIQAEYDPISKSGMEGANRKVKGTLHWVSADHCHKAQVRVYDRLFKVENPSADERDFRELLNPESLKTIDNCYVENYAAERKPGEYLQFQRIGYFMADLDSTADNLVFNKTVGLKDAWAKQKK